MEGISGILEYFDKHIGWRNIALLVAVLLGFGAGYYICSAQRDKYEARLINDHTKEIKAYCDSANAAKIQANNMIIEYRLLIMRDVRKIDSLETIIKIYRNEESEK